MEFRKVEYEQGYTQGYTTITLENELDTMTIMFGGNGDLYWNISSQKEIKPTKNYFTITKENYEIFKIFNELYRKIDECEIYTVDPLEEELCFDAEERAELYTRTKELNELLSTEHPYSALCSDTLDTITWVSDDAPYEEGNVLKIYRSRDRERFLIEIEKRDKNKEDFSVEISNSGSRYAPFNVPFMEHYNSLCQIDPNYHQIHIEELLYQKKLSKTPKGN